MDQVRGRKAGFFGNDAVPFVEPREARSSWQEGPRPHLGQRELACIQRGEKVARKTQPPRQGERRGREDRRLPASEAESVAERHRAQVGSHAKRKVVEPEGLLGAYELAGGVCGVFDCPHYEHLTVPQKVA